MAPKCMEWKFRHEHGRNEAHRECPLRGPCGACRPMSIARLRAASTLRRRAIDARCCPRPVRCHPPAALAPNPLVEQTRWTGIAAVATLWSTQVVLIVALGFDLVGDRPLSYLALEADLGFLFGVGLMVSAALFVTFGRYLRDRYLLGVAFSIAMLVGMAGQFVAGVVPIGGAGTASRFHVAAALTLGASIPVVMWRFAADQPPGAWRRWCYALFWLEVAACATGITLSRNQVAPLAEILPALAFHAWVAIVTIGPGRSGRRRFPHPLCAVVVGSLRGGDPWQRAR